MRPHTVTHTDRPGLDERNRPRDIIMGKGAPAAAVSSTAADSALTLGAFSADPTQEPSALTAAAATQPKAALGLSCHMSAKAPSFKEEDTCEEEEEEEADTCAAPGLSAKAPSFKSKVPPPLPLDEIKKEPRPMEDGAEEHTVIDKGAPAAIEKVDVCVSAVSGTAAASASTIAKTGSGEGGGAPQTTEAAGVKNDHGGACMYHPDLGYVGDGPPETEAEAKLFALRAGLLPADACCCVFCGPICVHVG